jgi:HlyD family secretion protein
MSEADIGKVQAGQKATFTVTAFPGRTFTGAVTTIVPAGTTTSNVVTYAVLVGVDPTDVQLLPGMTANVTIITEQDDNAVLVPNSAIAYAKTQAGTGSAVYVLQNGAPLRTVVQTGSTDGTHTVIVSGLEAGASVITGAASSTSATSSAKTSTTSGTTSILNAGGAGGPPAGGAPRAVVAP